LDRISAPAPAQGGSHPGKHSVPGGPKLKSPAGGIRLGHPPSGARGTAVLQRASGTGRARVEGLGGPPGPPARMGSSGSRSGTARILSSAPGILSGSHDNSGRVVALARASRAASDLARLAGSPAPGPRLSRPAYTLRPQQVKGSRSNAGLNCPAARHSANGLIFETARNLTSAPRPSRPAITPPASIMSGLAHHHRPQFHSGSR
jgi:hypothetical protein